MKKYTVLFLIILVLCKGTYIYSKVVISEVQISGNNTSDDFIELYNSGDTPVDLSGWIIKKRTRFGTEYTVITIPSGKSIPAKGYFLWANSNNNFAASIGADVSSTVELDINESVALFDNTNTRVDAVAWGNRAQLNPFVEGSKFGSNPQAGGSIERKANANSTSATMGPGGSDEFAGNGYDSNNNSTDFVLRTVSQPQNTSSPPEPEIIPPPTPTLWEPVNGSSTTDSTPLFRWTPVYDPSRVYYEIQVSLYPDFSSNIIYQVGITTNSYEPSSALNAGLYYWRVRAKDGAGNYSSWTEPWHVVVTISPIRIGLVTYLSNKTVIYFGANGGGYSIYDNTTKITDVASGSYYYSTTISGTQIILKDNNGNTIGTYNGPIKVVPINPSTTRLKIGPSTTSLREYRGEFEIRVSGSYLLAINIVDKEEYLYSVVGGEMSPSWELEALKAQAVCARTYRDANWNRWVAYGYNLTDSTQDQVYPGTISEGPSTIQAVKDTVGVIIKYQGNPVTLYFYSSCGGYTANNEDVWVSGSPLGYLRAVVDNDGGADFCSPNVSGNTSYTWSYAYPMSTLESKLKANSTTAPSDPNATLVDVNIAQTDVSGRAKYVNIVYSNQTKQVSGATFRSVADSTLIKSTKWDYDPYVSAGYMYFAGKGYGHGVGMCQWGARGMVLKGYNYRDVLYHYYTGITITEPAGDYIPPPVPQLVYPSSGSYINTLYPTFDWSDVTDPSGVYYELQVSTSTSFVVLTISTSGLTSSAFTINQPVLRQTVYYWRVRAKDGIGNTGGWSSVWSVNIDTTPPNPPQGLYATAGSNYIVLQWNQNNETDLKEYNIYKSTLYDVNFVFISTISKNINYFYDYDVIQNITYYYKITATDIANNESTYSNTVQAVIISGQLSDTIPPAAITDLYSEVVSTGIVKLIWTNTGDDGYQNNIVNGRIHIQYTTDKSQAENNSFWSYNNAQIKISTTVVALTKSIQIISDFSVSSTYYFRLWLADEVLNWSNISNGTTIWIQAAQVVLPVPQLVSPYNGEIVNNLSPILDWNDVNITGVNYILCVDDEPYFVEPLVIDNFVISSSFFQFPFVLQNDTTYYWKVKCVDEQLNESQWSQTWQFIVVTTIIDTQPPPTPSLLYPQDKQKIYETSTTLKWSSVTDPSGVIYNIEVSTTAYFLTTVVSTKVYVTEYILDNLEINTSYYWRVQAEDTTGNKSSWSNAWQFVVVSSSVLVVDTTPPAKVTSFVVQPGQKPSSVVLYWISTGDDGYQGNTYGEVIIQYSSFTTVGFNVSNAQLKISTTIVPNELHITEIVNLQMFTTYYFALWLKDESDNYSEMSNVVSCVPFSIVDTIPPEIVYVSTLSKINLLGNKIVIEAEVIDDTGISEVVLYYKNSYVSTYSSKKFHQNENMPDRFIVEISPSSVTLQGIDYYIKATDLSGKIVSYGSVLEPKKIFVSQENQAVIKYGKVGLYDGNPYDGETCIKIPKDILNEQTNFVLQQVDITEITPVISDEFIDVNKNNGLPLAVYDFRPYNFAFKQPIEMSLLYLDPDNDGTITDMYCRNTGVNENESLGIFFWNGNKWIYFGGQKNIETNTLTIKTSRLGRYAIFVVSSQIGLGNNNLVNISSTSKIVSPQVFTPQTPLMFSSNIKEVRIFSLNGEEVFYSQQIQSLQPIMWTGYDKNGNLVESGSYIYKAKTTEEKTVSGVVIFAK